MEENLVDSLWYMEFEMTCTKLSKETAEEGAKYVQS